MGQAKKRRFCPAQDREITSADCGANRLSHFACPENCPFNPFAAANYDSLLEIEDNADAVIMRRFLLEPNNHGAVARALADGHGHDHGTHARAVWSFFFERDATGRTWAERWRDTGFSPLKNDERVLLQGKMKMRVALLEIQRVIDQQRIEAVDLLDPEQRPLGFVDRSLAARATRFSTLLSLVYPLPHFWRLSGTAVHVDDIGPFTPLEAIEACVQHFRGPAELESKRRWLAENFLRVSDALTATGHERRRQMFAAMDACFGTATYTVIGRAGSCRKALATDASIDEDELNSDESSAGFTDAFVWFDPTPSHAGSAALLPGRRILGRVLVGPKEARVEAIGTARLDDLKQRFERLLGAKVQFSKERRDNVGAQAAAKEPIVDVALVPPSLLENPTTLDMGSGRVPVPPAGMPLVEYEAMLLQEQQRRFLDEPVPALDGRTPREAAVLPILRPKLVELMKARVRQIDERNLKTGRNDDINPTLRELGLLELDVPPPPNRPPLDDDEVFDEDDGELAEIVAALAGDRPAAPALQGPPFSAREAATAMDRAMGRFDTASAALKELSDSGTSIVDDIGALTGTMLKETEFNLLVTLLLPAWFSLVPLGVQAPLLDFDAMAVEFDRLCGRLGESTAVARDMFLSLSETCRQPGLLELLMAKVFELSRSAPKGLRIGDGAVPIMIVTLKVVIDELDRSLRRSE
jgi:hypothetical protein